MSQPLIPMQFTYLILGGEPLGQINSVTFAWTLDPFTGAVVRPCATMSLAARLYPNLHP
jgi:hypothetical protein